MRTARFPLAVAALRTPLCVVIGRWRASAGRWYALAIGLLLLGAAMGSGLAAAASYSATWTQVSATSSPGAPGWRGWSAMTWVGSENRIVLWGGSGAFFLNDIAGFDAVTNSWLTLDANLNCPGNTSFLRPNGSDENGVVYDPLSDLLWIYNGGSGYRCASTLAVGRIAGAGTTPTSIVDPTLSGATDDYYKDWMVRDAFGAKARVLSYVAATKTLTLHAAISVGPGAAYDLYVDFGDGTWSYSFATGQYAKLMLRYWGYAGYLPPPRRSAGFASDGTGAILFGGADYDNGTYVLDFATKSYAAAIAQGLPSSPAARGQIQAQFVYDSLHDRFVLFGGRCFDPGRCSYQAMIDDTWIYDANANSWTQVVAATRPPARNQGHMYFDAGNGVVVLYGGIGNGGTLFNDLWTFDVSTLKWTQQAMPATNPGGVYLGQVAYAPSTNCGYLVYGLKAGANATGLTWRLCLIASNTTFVTSASSTAPTEITSLAVVCPASGVLVVTGSGESAAISSFAGNAFIGLAYSIARDSTATDNGNVVQSSALATFIGDANRDFLNVQRSDSCTPGQPHTYSLTAYATTPQTSTANGSFVWNGRLTANAGPASSSVAAGITYVSSATNATPTIITTLPVVCPATGTLAVSGSGESAAVSNFAGNAFIGLAYSISRDSFAIDNGNVVQSSALAVFNGDANRDFLNVQRVDSCTPGLSYTYYLTAYATTAQTNIANASFVWNGRLTATMLPVATGFAPGTTLIGSATNAAPTVVTSVNIVCPASGTAVVTGSGESAALSSFAGNAFIGLAYSIARDSTATDNGNVVQSSALAIFNGDANRDFLNVQRADTCTPGLPYTYFLTAYATTPQTSIVSGSFVWNGRLVAILPP